MSLKVIHVFFILTSMIMCIGIAVFRFSAWSEQGGGAALVQAAIAAIGAVLLAGYAVHFVRKYGRLKYS